MYTKWTLYSKWCFRMCNKSAQYWLRPLHSAYCCHSTVVKTGVGQHVHNQRSKLGLELFPGLARLQAMWCNGDGLFCNVVKIRQKFNPKPKHIFTILLFLNQATHHAPYICPNWHASPCLRSAIYASGFHFSNNQIRPESNWIVISFDW